MSVRLQNYPEAVHFTEKPVSPVTKSNYSNKEQQQLLCIDCE